MKKWMDDSFTKEVGKELGDAVFKVEMKIIGVCFAALILMIIFER